MCAKHVKSVNPSQVELVWEKDSDSGITVIDAKNTVWEVPLTEKEFYEKWYDRAKAVYNQLLNKLTVDELGYHEMNNSWLEYDLFDLTKKNCMIISIL